MRSQGFILALTGAIAVAYFYPALLVSLPLGLIIDVGIGLIFFFYGLRLSPSELKLGFVNFPVHVVVQLTTFVVFPLLSLLFLPIFSGGINSELWLAIFFLAALPSTVSSSVVMVAIAKGNLPTAIFNASISGLIGIIATPLWLGIFMAKTGDFELLTILSKLFFQIMLPLIIGLLLQPFFGEFVRKHSSRIGLFDKTVIVLIVYSSFSNSFKSGVFQSVAMGDLVKIGLVVFILFFVVYSLSGFIGKKLGFDKKDVITTRFCGTKKSLVHGSVMAKIIFSNSAGLGIFLLPIMLYHILQLILVAFFAENYRKQWLKDQQV